MTSYFDTVLQFLGFIFSPIVLIAVLIVGFFVGMVHLVETKLWRYNGPFRVFARIVMVALAVFIIPLIMWIVKNFEIFSWTVRA